MSVRAVCPLWTVGTMHVNGPCSECKGRGYVTLGPIKRYLRRLDERSARRNHPGWSERDFENTWEVREKNRIRGKDRGYGSWNRRADLGIGWVLLQKAAGLAADRGMLGVSLRLNRWSWKFDGRKS